MRHRAGKVHHTLVSVIDTFVLLFSIARVVTMIRKWRE